MPRRTLFEMLCADNLAHPRDFALNYYGRRITFGQLFDRIETAARAYPAIAEVIRGTRVHRVIIVSPADSLPPVTKVLYRLKNKVVKGGPEAISWADFTELGAKTVPVIHYLRDAHEEYKGNVLHTVVADPISMEGLTEQEGFT